jgi:hypothetical protein
MKLSRRDFVHAACTVAAASLVPAALDQAIAGYRHAAATGGFVISQRNIANVNFTFTPEYAFINTAALNSMNPTLNGASPFDGFSLTPYNQCVDQNGYINIASASGQNVGMNYQSPSTANFSGPWLMQWNGDGRLGHNTFGGPDTYTFTELNLVTSATATFTGSSADIAFSNAFDPTVVASGAVRVVLSAATGGFNANQIYFVISAGLSMTNIRLSATRGGSAIVASAPGSTTLNGTYTRNSNGSWTNRPGIKPYILYNVAGVSSPSLLGGGYLTGGTPVAISSYSWSGGVLTVNTSAHGRPIGDVLNMTFQGSSSAVLANCTTTCTITSATQFTCPFAVDPTPIATPGTFTAFLTNINVIRQADEADQLAGNIFRTAWKREYALLRPSGLRFMNW